MASPFLIIDGYNLLHAAELARARYGPGDLERCRQRLLMQLSRRLTPRERARTTVVFDAGDAPPHVPRRALLNGLEVLFPAAGGDADTLIEELIAGHSAPQQLFVVSSDHRLQRAARRRQAGCVDSEEFWESLAARGPQPRTPTRHAERTDPTPSDKELAYWLQVFGQARIDEVLESESPSGQPPEIPPHPPAPPEPRQRDQADWRARVADLERLLDDPEKLEAWLDEPPDQ